MATTPHSSWNLSNILAISPQLSALSYPSQTTWGQPPSAVRRSEAPQIFQSAATASGSVRSAFSSAPSYTLRNSEIAADTTTCPSSLISTRSGAVSPINSAAMPYFNATCSILPMFSRSHDMTTRLASSPNSSNSGGNPSDVTFTFIPMPLASPDSTSVTAMPPSEQS